jgi:dienelactone hydrolase
MLRRMEERFAQLPASLRAQSVAARLGPGVPVLLAHPDAGWADATAGPPVARPVMIWIHGRTVSKELDPGRYLRWIRAGIAACALDLPCHGERFVEGQQGSDRTLEIVDQMAGEIDGVLASLAEPRWRGAFDLSRVGIGGMSAGGMATLIRLCSPHRFRCAAVESTAGDFAAMSGLPSFATCGGRDPERTLLTRLNPASRLSSWRAVPLLALHSEADEWVPVGAMRSFCESLSQRYAAAGAPSEWLMLKTWERTGAPNEHAGFGKVAAEAKEIQVKWLERWLT